MPLAAQQHAIDPREWIPLDEAASLLGESERTLRWRCTSSWASSGLATMVRQAMGRPSWMIHRRVDPRLSLAPDGRSRDDVAREALILRFPRHCVDRAYRKAHWMHEWRRRVAAPRLAGCTDRTIAEDLVAEARSAEGEDFRVSVRSLQAWWSAYNEPGEGGAPRGLDALVDRYHADPAEFGSDTGSRSVAAVDHFYLLYHCQSRPTLKRCHALTLTSARLHGWSWPASDSSTRRWLTQHDNLSLSYLLREGKTAWQRKYMPFDQVDHALIQPGDLFVCDHHQLDLWCEHEGVQLRPWLTAIQDDRSRCVVGWHLGIAPHQDAILSAMRRAFRQWSIPRNMRIDNGRDYTSRLMTGVTKAQRDKLRAEYGPDWARILERDARLAELNGLDPRFKGMTQELGINLIYAIPYSPWSKGTLERWFGTFEENVGKQFATYCGNSTLTRPECLEAIRRGYTREQKRDLRKRYGKAWKKVAALKFVDESGVPSLEEVRAAVGEWIDVYHRSAHRGQGMEGDAPQVVWDRATSLRRAEDQSLSFLLQARGVYKVNANGVTFKVGNETLSYGADEPRLQSLRGREVFITLDPDDLSFCLAWTPDRERRRFLARLQANARISPLATVDELRTASANLGRRRRLYRRADAESAKRMRTVAQEIRARAREQAAQLRATGTLDASPLTKGAPTTAASPLPKGGPTTTASPLIKGGSRGVPVEPQVPVRGSSASPLTKGAPTTAASPLTKGGRTTAASPLTKGGPRGVSSNDRDLASSPSIEPVRTGFEGVSIREGKETAPRRSAADAMRSWSVFTPPAEDPEPPQAPVRRMTLEDLLTVNLLRRGADDDETSREASSRPTDAFRTLQESHHGPTETA